MQKRSGTVPWRYLGGCVAVLACLAATGPVRAQGTPGLAVSIIPDKQAAAQNEVISYRMTVDNFGNDTVPNARVTLSLINNADYVSGSSSLNGVPIQDKGGNPFLAGISIGDVAPGQEMTLGFQLQVIAAAPGSPVTVQASWQSDLTGSTVAAVVYTPTTTGDPKLDFQKTADKATASAGQTITYTMVVRNTGTGTALNVRLQDSIPPWTHYVPGSTTVNGQSIPDRLGGSPLEDIAAVPCGAVAVVLNPNQSNGSSSDSQLPQGVIPSTTPFDGGPRDVGLPLGDIAAGSPPVTVTMQVQVNDNTPTGIQISNTAHGGNDGTPTVPTNTVTTTVIQPPIPVATGVPNLVELVPSPSYVPVTGSPTDVTFCPTNCSPTTAKIHVSTDIGAGVTNTWLEVLSLDASGGASIQPGLGVDVGERLGRAALIAPGVDTVFEAQFPQVGGEVGVTVSFTPKAEQLVMLHQIMRRIAAQAGVAPPTALQVLSMYRRVPTLPSLSQALQDFGPLSTVPALPEEHDGTGGSPLSLPTSLDVEQLTLQIQNSANDLYGMVYSPHEMDTFREALQASTGQPFSNLNIRLAVRQLSDGDPQLDQLINELALVIGTRQHPARLLFSAQKLQ